jgi:conjugal transfer pilus assembly protein TraU
VTTMVAASHSLQGSGSRTGRVRTSLVVVGVLICLLLLSTTMAEAYCPKTNILSETFSKTWWECMFPLSLIGVTIYNMGEDDVRPALGPGLSADFPPQLCGCECLTPYLCIPGLPMGIFVPADLVEVVRNPLCFPSLSGLDLGADPTFIDRGMVDVSQDDPALKFSYYHVHFIIFPLWSLLGTDFEFVCTSMTMPTEMDISYLSELDPSWNDDVFSLILYPEGFLFANPVATAACAVDAVAASVSYPLDPLFWCAGSFGNIYPPSGFTSGSYSGQVKPAALAMTRVIARLARVGVETYWAADEEGICTDIPTFLIVKSQYKFQLLYPIPDYAVEGNPCCSPLGRTQLRWGLAKTYPVDGDDFVFLLWKLQRCCLA